MNSLPKNNYYQKVKTNNYVKQIEIRELSTPRFSTSNKNIKNFSFNNYKNKAIYYSNLLRNDDKSNDTKYSKNNLQNKKPIQEKNFDNIKVNLSNYAFLESKCFSNKRSNNNSNLKILNRINNRKNMDKKDENNTIFFSIYKNHNFPKSNQNNLYNSLIINHFKDNDNYFINNQNNFSETKNPRSRFHNNSPNNDDIYKIRNKTLDKVNNEKKLVNLDPRINKYLKKEYIKKSSNSYNNLLETTDNRLFKIIYIPDINSHSFENQNSDFFNNSMNNISISDTISENININEIKLKRRRTLSPQRVCSFPIKNYETKFKSNKKNNKKKKSLVNSKKNKNKNKKNSIKEISNKKKKTIKHSNNIKKISFINNISEIIDNKLPSYNEDRYISSASICSPLKTNQNETLNNDSNNNSINTSKNEIINNDLLEKINIENISESKQYILKNMNKNIENSYKENTNSFIKKCEAISVAGIDLLGTKTNQDTYLIERNINNFENFNMFGVLDGHGIDSHLVSQFIKDFIIFRIKNHPLLKYLKNLTDIYNKLIESKYKIIANIYKDADTELQKVGINVINSGTTCVIVIQIEKHLICANVGDSRAILIYDENINDKKLKNTLIFPLSYDCKPNLPNEKLRIEKFGGIVMQSKDNFGNCVGPYRVWNNIMTMPGIAMSRSIGDIFSKSLGVIPDPQIVEYTLSEKTKYMVICSDGVWEFISNEDIMKIGNKYYIKNDAENFCFEIVNLAFNLWRENDNHVDDITSVVVFF